jgi:hypothetical protein
MKLLSQKTTGSGVSSKKYLLYALGEIALVMIGILLALQVNNWNSDRIQKNKLETYFQELKTEFDSLIVFEENRIPITNLVIDAIKNCQEGIVEGTSAGEMKVRQNIGFLGTAILDYPSYPVFEEFLNEGLLTTLTDREVKENLQEVKTSFAKLETIDKSVKFQYENAIERFISKHINYSENAIDLLRDSLVIGGPPTDYDHLMKSLEFWNLLTFKLEISNQKKKRQEILVESLKQATLVLQKAVD